MRKIIHIDMDAFYASIEQRDNEAYRGKPLVVGGSPDGRGVVAAASYEARKFGIRSATSSKRAIQLCPDVIFVYPRFNVYKKVSRKIREIFRRYTDLIEPLSLDEAYLDVTEDKLGIGSAIDIATDIRRAIKDELNLTASAGISVNKFIAKVASDLNKPNGQTFIGPSRIEAFMEDLPIEKFLGVGKVTAQKMKKMGIHKGADLKQRSEADLVKHFGKSGKFYFKIVRGIDERKVQSHRKAKSVGAEDTFPYDLVTPQEMHEQLDKIGQIVYERLKKHNLKGRTITLKVKFHDFKQITRSKSLDNQFFEGRDQILLAVKNLLDNINFVGKKVRLLGISLSNFSDQIKPKKQVDKPDQLNLF